MLRFMIWYIQSYSNASFEHLIRQTREIDKAVGPKMAYSQIGENEDF